MPYPYKENVRLLRWHVCELRKGRQETRCLYWDPGMRMPPRMGVFAARWKCSASKRWHTMQLQMYRRQYRRCVKPLRSDKQRDSAASFWMKERGWPRYFKQVCPRFPSEV